MTRPFRCVGCAVGMTAALLMCYLGGTRQAGGTPALPAPPNCLKCPCKELKLVGFVDSSVVGWKKQDGVGLWFTVAHAWDQEVHAKDCPSTSGRRVEGDQITEFDYGKLPWMQCTPVNPNGLEFFEYIYDNYAAGDQDGQTRIRATCLPPP